MGVTSTGTSMWPSTHLLRPESDSASAKPFGALCLLPATTWRTDRGTERSRNAQTWRRGEDWRDPGFRGAANRRLRPGGRLYRTLLPAGAL